MRGHGCEWRDVLMLLGYPVTVLLVVLAGLGGCTEGEDDTVTDTNKAIVRGYLEDIVSEGDLSSWDRYFGERVLFNGSEMTREDFGRVIGYFRSFLSDLHLVIDDQIAEGGKVATRVTFRGTHSGEIEGMPPTGKQVEFRGFAIDRLVDGTVVEMWHEVDMHGLLQQLRRE